MDNLFTLGITLSAIDQFSKPLANMANSVGIFGKKINNTKLNGISKEIEGISKELESLGVKKSGLEKKFRKYSQEAYRFNKILRDTDKEIEKLNKEKLKLEKEFKKGTVGAKKFNNSIEKIDRELNRLNSKRVKIDEEFRRANAQANILKRGISRVSEKINSLNSKKLELRGEFSKISKEIEQSKERLNSFALKLSSIGAIAIGVGRQVGGGLLGFVKDYKEVEKAQGDIASLGIDASGIEKITKTAKQMSNQFAGVTAPDFIKASYDIKSGIASLSSEGVAEFTKFATVTASATKSSVDEMTKLFALGYGIFKRANESDIDFGKRFSASIGKAVQAFRTDGSDLVQGISNIGATAKAMGVSLEQELAIIGKAKDAFSSAAEAGTAYRAFLAGAVNAQKELGVSFLDTKGKLLPMYMVLEQIKKKFGKTIDANEMAKLKKAFGSEEAVKIITALINKTKELKNAQKDLMSAEYSDTEVMAKARNKGKEFELLGQRLHNLAATFGKVLAPAVDWVSEKIGKFSMWLSKFAQNHKWVSWVVAGVAALSILAVTLGGIGIAAGAVVFGFSSLGKGVSLFKFAAVAATAPVNIFAGSVKLLGSMLGFSAVGANSASASITILSKTIATSLSSVLSLGAAFIYLNNAIAKSGKKDIDSKRVMGKSLAKLKEQEQYLKERIKSAKEGGIVELFLHGKADKYKINDLEKRLKRIQDRIANMQNRAPSSSTPSVVPKIRDNKNNSNILQSKTNNKTINAPTNNTFHVNVTVNNPSNNIDITSAIKSALQQHAWDMQNKEFR